MSQFVLVTGGMGFVGSHTCVALAAAGYTPVIFDNLCNSDEQVLDDLHQIIGNVPRFIKGDVRDSDLLAYVLAKNTFQAVIHFAGLKAVAESVENPFAYFHSNVHGSLALASGMQRAGVNTLIFSSSATVYGESNQSPISENALLRPTNPYGRSKLMVEEMLEDLCKAQLDWRVVVLRYFNPVGAHESGLIGEQSQGRPSNLMPCICEVATGLRDALSVHGTDYPTPDGTAVRDYVHVMDVAEAHVAALKHAQTQTGLLTLNLGTGRGASVLEVLHAFERVSGCVLPYRSGPRRPGDLPAYWSNPSRAHAILGWHARRDLDQMCADAWRRQQGLRPAPY